MRTQEITLFLTRAKAGIEAAFLRSTGTDARVHPRSQRNPDGSVERGFMVAIYDLTGNPVGAL